MQHEEILGFHEPMTPPPVSTGLAALAVQQSTSSPLAPPSRKLANYVPPAPAIAAAGLAFVSHAPNSVEPPRQPQPSPVSAPSNHHFHAVQTLQHQDVAQLRLDLEAEISQVRQDLFSAAMGVSALKDRLDGQEAVPGQPYTPALSQHDIDRLVRAWLDIHLPSYVEQSVQKSLDQALQQTVATLSSSEFFRMPVHLAGQFSDPQLSRAPQILSSFIS